MEEQLIKKLGLQNHKNLLEKTTELLRLLDLRSSAMVSTINEYAKISICVDLAAPLLGITIDLMDVIKQSGLKKSAYEKNKRTIQKLLDLNKPPGINEICVKLNCNEVSQKAKYLLDLYKEHLSRKNENDIDLTHPQYSAMAVFQACKLSKTKILKPKILAFSYLRPSQWARLEQQWDKIIVEYEDRIKCSVVTMKNKKQFDDDKKPETERIKVNRVKHTEIEDYLVWKNRIIQQAKEAIKRMQQEHLENEVEFMDLDDSF